MAKLLKIGSSVTEIEGIEIGTKEEIEAGIAEAKPVTVSENEIGGVGVKTAKSIVVGEDVFNIPGGSAVEVSIEEPEEGTPEAKSITVDDVTYKLGSGGGSEPVHIHWEDTEETGAALIGITISAEELAAVKGKTCRIIIKFEHQSQGTYDNVTQLMTLDNTGGVISYLMGDISDGQLCYVDANWTQVEGETTYTIGLQLWTQDESHWIRQVDIYSME